MKLSKIFTVAAFALVLSLNCNVSSFAAAKSTGNNPVMKVAIVDVPRIVSSSKQIEKLRNDQQQKLADLQKFVENARADVQNEKDDSKKKALEDKYNKELNDRKNALDKDNADKLRKIEQDILTVINAKAKAKGYDLVLTKTSILFGGDDITDEIAKSIK